ncbi:hypothetical protein AAULR_14456, partial [Lacticaseibacillus rhamnosus MTCC 5462]
MIGALLLGLFWFAYFLPGLVAWYQTARDATHNASGIPD